VAFANSPTADAATIAALRARLGLDLPLWRQFLDYLAQLARGDLGLSVSTGQPVASELLARLPASAELALAAFGLAVLLALPLGAAAALRPGGAADHACRWLGTLGLALPGFVTGLLLIDLFYLRLGWAPEPIGRLDPFALPPPGVTGFLVLDTLLAGDPAGCLDALRHLALPAATLALAAAAPLARVTRGAMRGVLGRDFIRAARAHRLAPRTVLLSYAARNAALPVVTTMGLVFPALLGAGVVVERVFAWPGLGSYALDALLALDHAPVQGFVLLMAVLVLAVNLLVDLLCAAIDPRAGLLPDA
jgi:peptide/nickel transport system permease protein